MPPDIPQFAILLFWCEAVIIIVGLAAFEYAVPHPLRQGDPAIIVLNYCMPLFRNYSDTLQNAGKKRSTKNGKRKIHSTEEAPDP